VTIGWLENIADREKTAKALDKRERQKRKKGAKLVSKGIKSLLAIVGVVLISGILSAQAPTSKIYGVVTDEEGTPLPGVTVEATSPSLIGKATGVTDASGTYRLFALMPGTYRVSFTLQGFKPKIREGIVVLIEQTLKLDIKLEIGALTEEVTVVGQSPLIDVKSTIKGMTLTKEMFELLPRGRNFDTLVTAVPGVNTEPWLGGLSVDGASGAENMFYIDGSDITRTDVGTRRTDAAFEFVEEVKINASGYPAEFGGALGGVINVVTRQGGNEYHGEIIGYYEGSKLTGDERDTLRLNPYDYTKAEYVNYQTGAGLKDASGNAIPGYGKDLRHRIEAGFSLGGYILKDKLWFFGSALPVFTPIKRHVDFLTTPVISGDYKQNNYAYNFQAKLTAQPAGFMRVGASFVNNFSKYKGNLPARDGTGNPADTYDQYGYSYPNYVASGFADLTFGNNLMVNIRGGRFYYNTTDQLVKSTSPGLYNYGYGTSYYPAIPAAYQKPRNWGNHPRIYETNKSIKYKNHVDADVTYYLNLGGEHAFKAGFSWVRQGEDEDSTINQKYPEMRFYWGRNLILGGINYGKGTYGYLEVRGNNTTGVFGGFWNVYNNRYAVYGQDSWTIADRFTLNIGLRAETEYLPPYANPADIPPEYASWKPMEFKWDDKLSPRLGFIYDVFGDASLKLFGTYGLYYDVIKTYMAAHSYSGFKWKSAYYQINDYHWLDMDGNTYLPGPLIESGDFHGIYDWRHPSFESTDPDLHPVSNREITFGAEKMLMENLSVTARFVQKHLRYTIEDVGFIEPGVGEVYYEANPGYGYTLHIGHGTGKMDPAYPETPKAKREYYALNLSIDKRLANNWLAGFSYTWSRLSGNYSGLGSSDEFGRVSPYVERSFDNWIMSVDKDLNYLDGLLPTDRTHFFKFYGAYTFPFHLTVGTVANAYSGVPISETWSVFDTYFYPFNRGWVREGTSGNTLKRVRTPFFWFVNAYAEYNLRFGKTALNFNVNIDNVTNNKIATRLYNYRTYANLNVDEPTALAGGWDIDDPAVEFVPDARYLMKMNFQDAISVRFGMKLIF
jgi:hypothetical protein